VGVYPVVIDSRPAYLGDGEPIPSLLLVAVGSDSLVAHLLASLETVTHHPPAVIAPPGIRNGYRDHMAAAAPRAGVVVDSAELEAALAEVEPSDSILVVDARRFSPDGSDLRALVSEAGSDPRWATHLVAFAEGGAGTREYAELDPEGRVRRIRRYYDSVTWPYIEGVAASLLPSSSVRGSELFATPLPELRGRLAARGVPTRDLPMGGDTFDLAEEEGLLALSEHVVLKAAGRRAGAGPVLVGSGQSIHPGARLVGPVVVERDVVVEEHAVVLGPALLSAGARIGRGAIVTQAVVGPGCIVPGEGRVQRRLVLAGDAASRRAVARAPNPAGIDEAEVVPAARARYIRAKRVVEATLAALALLLLLPLLLLIALLIVIDSPGPVLFAHDREGRRGRRFRCWKFRTMRVNAEAEERALRAGSLVDGPQFKLARDPRLTRMGRLLRPSSLDELPQLLNVVVGEMALVGPRPSPFRENQLCVAWREGRLSVRPGITGLWQVCRHDRGDGDFHQWIEYDLLYVRRMSLALDLRILAATILTLGGRRSVPLSTMLPGQRS
jgi:lipopolysaccharide/colanic/teichoic acid biosynthesis glycosyltransferase